LNEGRSRWVTRENPKYEARNSKQIRITKIQSSKRDRKTEDGPAKKMAGKPSKKSGGQVLVWPKGKNEDLVEKQAVPIIQAERLNFWIDGDKRGFLGFLYMDISICVYTYGVLQETWFENGFFIALV
jgi:hypothetical protein